MKAVEAVKYLCKYPAPHLICRRQTNGAQILLGVRMAHMLEQQRYAHKCIARAAAGWHARQRAPAVW